MPVLTELKGQRVPIKVWSKIEDIESSALDQLKNIAALPRVFHHVAAMPDLHWGNGACVGSVIAQKGAVSPAAVGVDLGCGMMAVKITGITSTHLEGKLPVLRHSIERGVPVGFNAHSKVSKETEHWKGWESFSTLHEKVQDRLSRAQLQLGTLGGGNHFIEVCLDTNNEVWVMLHSGSRNIGKEIAEVHIGIAKSLISKLMQTPDPDLAYFIENTPEFKAYIKDLTWAQNYAMANRESMMQTVLQQFGRVIMGLNGEIPNTQLKVNCHHNYVAKENHYGEEVLITRKGAVNAEVGRYGIIPGSMGTKSYIVRGKGNPESFNSCSHGAGRKMSRGKAKKAFTVEDVLKQTEGVECRKDSGIIDEIPGAYKDISTVMSNQTDLVEVVAEIKQVLCVKG